MLKDITLGQFFPGTSIVHRLDPRCKLLIEETDKIMSAQKARGADFETGNLIQRAKALLPLLVPLFVSAFRRADELAVAMECRCYHGDQGRTRMKQLEWRMRDTLALLWGALVLAGMIVLSRFGL